MHNHAVLLALGIGGSRADLHADGVFAVVAGEGVKGPLVMDISLP
jgi:hypothetical protein